MKLPGSTSSPSDPALHGTVRVVDADPHDRVVSVRRSGHAAQAGDPVRRSRNHYTEKRAETSFRAAPAFVIIDVPRAGGTSAGPC